MYIIQQNKNTRSLYWLYQNLEESQDPFVQDLLNEKIRKKITFDFYCIYKAYCSGWNATVSKSDIKLWYDQEIRTLLDFSKNYIKNIESSLEYRIDSKKI